MNKLEDPTVLKTNNLNPRVFPDVPTAPQETTPTAHFPSHKLKKKNLIIIIEVLLLLGSLIAGMFVLRQRHDIRSRASNTEPVLSLLPATNTVEIGQEENIVVSINTNTRLVTSVRLDMIYNKNAIEIVRFIKGPEFQNALQEPSTDNGKITAILTTPITTPFNGITNVATITIKVKTAGESEIKFTNSSTVTAKGTVGNTLADTRSATITGINQTTPTMTPTPLSQPANCYNQCKSSFSEKLAIYWKCLQVCNQIKQGTPCPTACSYIDNKYGSAWNTKCLQLICR